MTLAPALTLLLLAAPTVATPSAHHFVYCMTASTSPRGQGLIITEIFSSRSDPDFIRTAFSNFLRDSYAPYGNGWMFSERAVSCQAFDKRRNAEIQRSLNISRVPQPIQSVYNVIFQIG
jgi:hypothetical protein|tara:strand:+ start:209 stop:565 length:357 start_codon:yes stop_codon:yes gene_type:complete